MKAAKEEWTEGQCENIEKGIVLGNSKEDYNILKALTKTQQHKSAVIEGGSGNTLTESTSVRNRWTKNCSGLYTYELRPGTSLLQSNQTPTQEAERLSVLREEADKAVRSLKAGKSADWTTFPLSCLRKEQVRQKKKKKTNNNKQTNKNQS